MSLLISKKGVRAESVVPFISYNSVFLVLANLVPLAGVLFWGWNQGELFFIYWSESAIIGFYTILKIVWAKGTPGVDDGKLPEIKLNDIPLSDLGKKPKAFVIIFFIFHFGIFMFVHGVFLSTLFSLTFTINVLLSFILLFVSHGISFIMNFIGTKEYLSATPGKLLVEPYYRLFPVHFAIVLSALVKVPLFIFVIVKIAVDLSSHLQQRKAFRKD